MLWNLSTDYYLHHADPRTWHREDRKNYIHWFTPSHLEKRRMPLAIGSCKSSNVEVQECSQDYWLEYYRPLSLSSFVKLFSYRMNSTLRYIPAKSTQEAQLDLSPFRPRIGSEQDASEKERTKKGVTIIEPIGTKRKEEKSEKAGHLINPEPMFIAIPGEPGLTTLKSLGDERLHLRYGLKTAQEPPDTAKTFKDKTVMTQWTLNQFISSSLNPSVSNSELEEYGRYMNHPLNLPLVVSDETNHAQHIEFMSYLDGPSKFADDDVQALEEDVVEFTEFLDVEEEPLTVTEADLPKKRYKAYGQWLRGKSLFKQSRIDL